MINLWCLFILLLLSKYSLSNQISITQLTNKSDVIFQGQIVANITQFSTNFLLLKLYKGSQHITSDHNRTEKYVEVQGWVEFPNEVLQPGSTAIIFCDVNFQQCHITHWSHDNELQIWRALGWGEWNAWSPCSETCGNGGMQERRRSCKQKICNNGHSLEIRHCNFFFCNGAVSPLLTSETRGQFHPARRLWHRPPERPSAWRLLPDSYVWVPSAQIFPKTLSFPNSFTVLLTVRVLEQDEGGRGALFSLSSRRQPDAYLSLELVGNGLRLVHANHGESRSVNIPAVINDGEWHWLAICVREHSSVTAYMDCTWVSTEVLPHNSLDIPKDADLVVGYLFQGDLEQLIVSSDPEAVAKQCSHAKAIYQGISPKTPLIVTPAPHAQPVNYRRQYEIEWTAWSICNASCNEIGVQTRQSRCIDKPLAIKGGDTRDLELCIESGGEVTQSKECIGICKHQKCQCLNGGICHKKHHCHCPPDYTGHKCQIKKALLKKHHHHHHHHTNNCSLSCVHGICINSKCICHKNYKGKNCDIILNENNNNNKIKYCKEKCLNGGSCLNGQCFCTQGFSGTTCNKPRCDTLCQNGGTCLGKDRCLCHPQYTGHYCETKLCPDKKGRSKRQLFIPRYTSLLPLICP